MEQLQQDLENPENATRQEIEKMAKEQVKEKLEEILGRSLTDEEIQLSMEILTAFQMTDVELTKEGGTVTIPLTLTYEDGEGTSVAFFFLLVMTYDMSTTPPTPLGFELIALEQDEQNFSTPEGDLRLERSSTEEDTLHLSVRDQGNYDGNREEGKVSAEVALLGGNSFVSEETPASGGGGSGCGLGISVPLGIFLILLPLLLFIKK